MSRNGYRIAIDVRPDMVQAVRHDAEGLRSAQRDIAPAGEDARQSQLSALRELAAELSVGRREVDITLPRAEAIEKQLLLPRVDAHELEPLVRFQLAKDLPIDLDDLAIAWHVVPRDDFDGLQVDCVAVRRDVVEAQRDLLLAAGLRVGRLVVATEAAARGLVLSGAAQGRQLLLDVHAGATDIVVVCDGRLTFSRTSSLGPGADDWQPRLAAELSRTLMAAEAQTGGAPTGLTLAGAPAAELADLLQQRLGLQARALQKHEQALAARGLADPTPLPGLEPLDLAHAARSRLVRRRKQQGAVFGIVAAVVAAVVLLVVRAQFQERREQVAALQTQRAGLKPKARDAGQLRGELDTAAAWTARKGRELEVLLAVTRALPGDDAYLTQVRWSENGDLQLSGRAKEWETVGAFFAALDREPLVEASAFADVRRPREKDALGYVFTGSARLRRGGAQ